MIARNHQHHHITMTHRSFTTCSLFHCDDGAQLASSKGHIFSQRLAVLIYWGLGSLVTTGQSELERDSIVVWFRGRAAIKRTLEIEDIPRRSQEEDQV